MTTLQAQYDGKQILRPKQTQAKLGIGHSKFWEDVKAGRLPPVRRFGPKTVGHTLDEINAVIDQAPRV